MRLLSMTAIAAIAATALMTSPTNASQCLDDFSHHLNHLAKHAKRLRPACWQEAQKGESNYEQIIATCSGPDWDRIIVMRDHKEANKKLCGGKCKAELTSQQLCVDNKPLAYYLTKVGAL